MNYYINDYELLYLIKDNDESYQKTLFDKYFPVVNHYALLYYHRYKRLSVELDDLTQEGLIGLNYAINHFDSSRNVLFYTYAILCIESRIMDYIRKTNHLSKINPISIETSINDNICIADTLSSNDNAIDNTIFNDLCKQLTSFLMNLSNNESEIFELKVNGFSNKEISILLDINYQNVYYYVHKIRSKLKNTVL